MSSKTPGLCSSTTSADDLPDDDEFVHAIDVDDARYFLHTVVEPKAYRLFLGNGLECFDGSVEKKPDDKERALTAGGSEYVYRLEPLADSSQARFSWKQRVADGVQRKLGETVLRRVDDCGGQRILDAAMRIVQRREQKVARLQEELEKSRSEQARSLEQLSKFERLKKDMEEELYAKFSLVLNAKKRRIVELTGGEPDDLPASPPDATSSTSQATGVQGLLDTLLDD